MTPNTAVCNGAVIDRGGTTLWAEGVVWSVIKLNPELYENKKLVTPMKVKDFAVQISGLRPKGMYYVRAFATNRKGMAFGEERMFTTPALNTGSFTDNRDDRTYKWVEIGDQVWMAENLAHIPYVCPPENQGGIWVYNYQGYSVSEAKTTEEYKTYGCLYDFETACDLCPDGWHLPSDDEWKELEMYLGMSLEAADELGYRGTDEATYMKETGYTHWSYGSRCYDDVCTYTISGTNVTGFTALPGGLRSYYFYGECYGLGTCAVFYTSSKATDDQVWSRELSRFEGGIRRSNHPELEGYSVRCVKDKD